MDPNLQQILSQQLRDVHLPEQAGWWPLAIGWWILIALIVVAIAVSIVYLVQHKKRNRYRTQALQQLQKCYSKWQSKQDTVSYLQSVNAVLKRSVLHIGDTNGLIKLTGNDWIKALNRLVKKPLSEQTKSALSVECYQAESTADVELVQREISQWLKLHDVKLRGQNA